MVRSYQDLMYLFVALFLGSGPCKLLETLHRENFYFRIYEINLLVIDEKCRGRSGFKSWSLSLSDKINFRYVLSRKSDKSEFFEFVLNRVDLVVTSATNYLPLSTWTTNFLEITFSLCQMQQYIWTPKNLATHTLNEKFRIIASVIYDNFNSTINRLKSDRIVTK